MLNALFNQIYEFFLGPFWRVDVPLPTQPEEASVFALSTWHLFVLAVIQTKAQDAGGPVKVSYNFIAQKARVYEAEYTSCQKIKEAFDVLEAEGHIKRIREGNGFNIEQKSYLPNPRHIMQGWEQ